MTSVYGRPGYSQQQIGGECPPAWVKMDKVRPGIAWVATVGGEWIEAPAPVPLSASRYQLREALRLSPFPKEGYPDWTLFDAFDELLSAPTTPAYYRRAWDELEMVQRASAMVNASADVLGLKPAQLDDVYRLAATLKA